MIEPNPDDSGAKPRDIIGFTAAERSALTEQLASRPTRALSQSAPGGAAFDLPPRRIIAIASGKGGVGKSTVAVNLAAISAAAGNRVGLLDADVHGFSVPGLLGTTAQPVKEVTVNGNRLHPPTAHGIKVISVGMFTDPRNAVVWRGPVAHRALTQFLEETVWGELDLLVVDLPPGTGSIAISISRLLPESELLVVTSPQVSSAEISARAGMMARHSRQRVAGVVENMSWLPGPNGERLELLGRGGGQLVAERLTEGLGYPVPLLGQLPLDPVIAVAGDQGLPFTLGHPESLAAGTLRGIAARLGLS